MNDSLSKSLTPARLAELEFKSIQYRKTILTLIHSAGGGHVGGSLSCVDILNALYNHIMDISPQNFAAIDRDHFIHSKGHSVQALYAVLLDKGFFTQEALDTYEICGSPFIGHPNREIAGIEQNTGALGHGLPMSVGMALAARMDKRSCRIFTILGDGEMAEGSNWEAFACAAHHKLDNLTAIIDRNTLQISGRTEDVLRLEPLEEKLAAFGFAVRHADGNNIKEFVDVCSQLPFEPGKPNAIIAHTVKGKGISFMADQAVWHHRVPTDAEYAAAMQELENSELEWRHKYGSS